MQELTFEQMEEANGGVAPLIAIVAKHAGKGAIAVTTVIAGAIGTINGTEAAKESGC